MLTFSNLYRYVFLAGVTCTLIFIILNAGELYQLIGEQESRGDGAVTVLKSTYIRLLIGFGLLGLIGILMAVSYLPGKVEENLDESTLAHGSKEKLEQESEAYLGVSQNQILEDASGLDLDKWKERYENGALNGNLSHDANYILSSLAGLLRASQGALYMKSGRKKLRAIAVYACERMEERDEEIEFGEGLVGEVAQINKYMYLEGVPDDTEKVVSGLGEATPPTLLLFPLSHKGEVNGVVELSSFHQMQEEELSDLNRISEYLGAITDKLFN